MSTNRPAEEASLRRRLREGLVAAMKGRDRVAMTALRSALAAIDNAEAVDTAAVDPGSLAIESSPAGAGAAEAERRILSAEDVAHIVLSELADRESAALEYDRLGRRERADALRAEARVLCSFLR